MAMLGRLALALAVAGCALDNQAPDGGGGLDFKIGTIPFHVSSGAVWTAGTTTLYLTDQPDACLAIAQVPIGKATFFALRVAAGGGTAVIAAGQGEITVKTGGSDTAGYPVSDGTVTWAMNRDGTYALGALDVGFSGTSDRLRVSGLTLTACQ